MTTGLRGASQAWRTMLVRRWLQQQLAGSLFSISGLVRDRPVALGGGLERVQFGFALDNGPYAGLDVEPPTDLFRVLTSAPASPSVVNPGRSTRRSATPLSNGWSTVVNVLRSATVPEPASVGLVLSAAAALLAARQRRGMPKG